MRLNNRFSQPWRVYCAILVFLFFFPLGKAAAQDVAQEARNKINKRCLVDKDLHGSLILLDTDAKGVPGAIFIVDPQRVDLQLPKLKTLYENLGLANEFPILGTVELPHAKWLEDARRILREVSGDPGDLINSLYYQDREGALEIALQGRLSCVLGFVAYKTQIKALNEKLGERRIAFDPAFIEAQKLIKRSSFLFEYDKSKSGGLLKKEDSWKILEENKKSGSFLAALKDFDSKFVSEPKLFGGFAQVVEKLDAEGEISGVDVYVWASRESPNQTNDIKSELQKALPGLPINVIEQTGGSWSELIAEIAHVTDSTGMFDGCEVTSFCFLAQWDAINNSNRIDGFDVFPVGRMSMTQQWAELDLLVTRKLIESSSNRKIVDLIGLTPEALRDSRPLPDGIDAFNFPTFNPTKGVLNFTEGLNHYRSSLFDKAAACFKEAALNNASRVEYRYWRALSELQQGNTEQAYAIILAAARRFNLSSSRPRQKVASSFERVQGEIRTRINELEMRAIRQMKTIK